jgi:hypothetical protein
MTVIKQTSISLISTYTPNHSFKSSIFWIYVILAEKNIWYVWTNYKYSNMFFEDLGVKFVYRKFSECFVAIWKSTLNVNILLGFYWGDKMYVDGNFFIELSWVGVAQKTYYWGSNLDRYFVHNFGHKMS